MWIADIKFEELNRRGFLRSLGGAALASAGLATAKNAKAGQRAAQIPGWGKDKQLMLNVFTFNSAKDIASSIGFLAQMQSLLSDADRDYLMKIIELWRKVRFPGAEQVARQAAMQAKNYYDRFQFRTKDPITEFQTRSGFNQHLDNLYDFKDLVEGSGISNLKVPKPEDAVKISRIEPEEERATADKAKRDKERQEKIDGSYTGQFDSNPIRIAPITYPERARRDNIEGVLSLAIHVQKSGKVEKVEYISGPESIYRDIVQDILYGWKFKPSSTGGKIEKRLNFNLTD